MDGYSYTVSFVSKENRKIGLDKRWEDTKNWEPNIHDGRYWFKLCTQWRIHRASYISFFIPFLYTNYYIIFSHFSVFYFYISLATFVLFRFVVWYIKSPIVHWMHTPFLFHWHKTLILFCFYFLSLGSIIAI